MLGFLKISEKKKAKNFEKIRFTSYTITRPDNGSDKALDFDYLLQQEAGVFRQNTKNVVILFPRQSVQVRIENDDT